MIHDIVRLAPIQRYIDDALALLDPFTTKEGKKLRLEFRRAQVAIRKTPLKLIMYNETRWLSRYSAIERLIKLKPQLQIVALSGGLDPRLKLANAKENQF